MLTENDKQLLLNLKKDNPEAYDLFMRREAEHRELLKTGCHDIRNIVTLLSGSYQLLGLTTPVLNSIPRFVQMGNDIKSLIKAFNDIALYRYSDTITLSPSRLSVLENSIRQNIADHHSDSSDIIRLICNNPDAQILTDTAKLTVAVDCLITNALEAGNTIAVVVSDSGNAPDADMSDKIFSPFCSDKQGHLGLGLAIAAETADALGGSISYSHDSGITSFTIRVPATSEFKALV